MRTTRTSVQERVCAGLLESSLGTRHLKWNAIYTIYLTSTCVYEHIVRMTSTLIGKKINASKSTVLIVEFKI